MWRGCDRRLGRQGRERLWFWPIGAAEGAICSAWTEGSEAEGSHFCYVLVLFCLDVRGWRACVCTGGSVAWTRLQYDSQ